MDLPGYVLLALGSLFAILNPLGTVPTFMAVTEHDEPDERVRMARRACIVAAAAMTGFALLGGRLLASFQVSIAALQIAGGLVILRVGMEMLGGGRRRLTAEERQEAIEKDDIAVTPLGIPLLCGPGSLTTAMVLDSQATSVLHYAILLASIVVVYVSTFGALWAAVRYSAMLGPTTMRVVGRIMGLLLAAIAVQFVLNGLIAAFPDVLGAR